MNKYFSPTIQIEEVKSTDILLASGEVAPVVEVKALEGVDTEGSKTAIFDASRFF